MPTKLKPIEETIADALESRKAPDRIAPTPLAKDRTTKSEASKKRPDDGKR